MAYAVCDRCQSALLGENRPGELRQCPYCRHPVRIVTVAEFTSTYQRRRRGDSRPASKKIRQR